MKTQAMMRRLLGFMSPKTQLCNDSDRPIFLIPICFRAAHGLSSGTVEKRLAKHIPAGGSIQVTSSEYDLIGTDSQIYIIFRAGDTDNLKEFLKDFPDNGVKLEPGEMAFSPFYLVVMPHLSLKCNEGKVIVGDHAGQLAPTTMAEGPIIESTSSPTKMTTRVSVCVQTQAKASLGPKASKTRLHNNSNRSIFLIPIRCLDGLNPRSAGEIDEKLAEHIPAGDFIEVACSKYDVMSNQFAIYILFRAGDTDNLEEFLKDFPRGVKVEPGEEMFLHYQLYGHDLFLECNEAKDIGDGNSGQQQQQQVDPASPEERTVTKTDGAQQIPIPTNRLRLGMVFFFRNARTVYLWSLDGLYLVAENDEVIALRDEKTRERDRARWSIEFVDNSSSVLRLKSCKGKYLTASDQPLYNGMTARKVFQSLPVHLDSSLELEPMVEGPHLSLCTRRKTFLCANGSTMDPYCITHDDPRCNPIRWDVEIVMKKFSKVLDLTGATDRFIPEEQFNQTDATSLILKNSSIEVISGSIKKLEHLESLNAKNSLVTELPPEVAELKKIRDIRIYRHEKDPLMESPNLIGFKTPFSVKEFKCLEKLCFAESGIILEGLENLTKLRRLGITKFMKAHGNSLCDSLEKLKQLKSLNVHALDQVEILDLHHLTSPPKSLRHLYLHGRLEKLPDWISSRSLQYLTKLILRWSHLKEDLLETLGELPKLVELQLHRAYDGEQLNFKNMQFPRLKIFLLHELEGLRSMSLEEGTLPSLEILTISRCQWLTEIPPGIKHIRPKKLTLSDMSHDFCEKAKADHKKDQIFKDIEEVYFTRCRAGYWESRTPADEGYEGFAVEQ